jgi:hypothetical protein
MKLLCLSPFLLLAAVSANQYEPEIRGLKKGGKTRALKSHSGSKSKSKSKSGSKNVCSEDFSLEVGEVVSTHEETEEFLVLLEEDDEVEVLHYGPFTVVAECDEDDLDYFVGRLRVKVNYPETCEEDLVVFGDINDCCFNTPDDEDAADGKNFYSVGSVPPGTHDKYLGAGYGSAGDDDYAGTLVSYYVDDDDAVNAGNNEGYGALMASNGFYIGYSGDKLIGMTTGDNSTAFFAAAFGATSRPSCIIAGKFNLMNFN